MKTLLAIILCGAVVSACSAGQEHPGEPLTLADPFVLFYEGTYYAYGTSSDDGFEVYRSDSLTSWECCPRLALDKADSYGEKGFWAPEVYRNPENGRFYLFYTAAEHLCVATADSPLGSFRQSEKRPMFEEKAIDSSLFIDDDGTPYLFFVRFTGGNVIWGAELESDWMSVKTETLRECIVAEQPWELAMGRVAEGPSVLKKEGVYYLIYSANHYKSQDYGVGYATSDVPLGNWIKGDGPILCRPEDGLVGTGHGALFRDRDGRDRYVFHAHCDREHIHPRALHIADVDVAGGRVAIDSRSIFTPTVRRDRTK